MPNPKHIELSLSDTRGPKPANRSWMVTQSTSTHFVALTPSASGEAVRALVFTPKHVGGAGVWMMQLDVLPKGVAAEFVEPGAVPCDCANPDGPHEPECPRCHLRYPTVEEARSAMQQFVPDDVLMAMVLYPWYVQAPRNLLQFMQAGQIHHDPVKQ